MKLNMSSLLDVSLPSLGWPRTAETISQGVPFWGKYYLLNQEEINDPVKCPHEILRHTCGASLFLLDSAPLSLLFLFFYFLETRAQDPSIME